MEPWVPYPSLKPPRPGFYSTYFDEVCTLSEIASEISRTLFVDDETLDEDKDQLSQTMHSYYRRMEEWHDRLPRQFDATEKPAAHILLLQYVCACVCLFLLLDIHIPCVPWSGYLVD
jgi:hypothetical protein